MTSPDPALDALWEVADRLYGLPADHFTAARDAAAKDAAAGGDKALAARVRALRRPAVAAWAVNLLVRHDAAQVDAALDVGAGLREAAGALDAEQLRALTRQRRQLTAAMATTARGLARDGGVRLTGASTEQVEGVLTAAMLDARAADVVRTGQLLKAFTVTGLEETDPAALIAVPEAIGRRATPVEATPVEHGRGLRVVPESEELRRERAEEGLHEAAEELAAAEDDHRRAEEELARWTARRLQVHDELDEARRRVAQLESDADRVEVEVEDAEVVRADAADALAEAREAHRRAVRQRDRLG